MHPRLLELTAYLDEQQAVLAAAVADVPQADRTTRPSPDRWSAAEILEHLVIIERRVSGFVRSSIEEARAAGIAAETESSPVLPSVPTAAVLDRTRKVVARPSAEPTGTMSVDECLHALDQVRLEMKAVLGDADGLALGTIVKPHPVLGPANMYQWVAFTAAHMGRHADQIREVGRAIAAAQGVTR